MAKKVLIVDDSAAELMQLRSWLHEAGYDTVTATNGKEAVAKATAELPAIVLMDVVMPETDGYEACRQLRANPSTKAIPVVIVSSKSQKADQLWATMQGAKQLIGKPPKKEDVLAAVKAFI